MALGQSGNITAKAVAVVERALHLKQQQHSTVATNN